VYKFTLDIIALIRYNGLNFKGKVMITGIYRLCFKNTNKVYIGQSTDIYLRYNIHKTNLRANKSSKKLQDAYTKYGLPTLDILVECCKKDLNKLEAEAIEIFDSIVNGFNTIDGNTHRSELKGELAGNAKYSNELVEEVFIYLVDNKLTHKEITEITGVSRGAISDISAGFTHRWLQEKYPKMYLDLLSLKGYARKSNKNTAKVHGKVYPEITSPEGVVFTVSSLRGFCREHNLNHGSLGEVLRGHKAQYKGWKIKQT
jgi:group I intron endonuclease